MARRFLFDFFGARDVVIKAQAIIVREFFAEANISQGVNEHAAAMLARFAVRVAGVIDEARFISANPRIDHAFAVSKSKEVHAGIVQILGDARPADAATGVLDDSFAAPKRFPRENAATVHAGFLYHDGRFFLHQNKQPRI